MRRPDQPSGLGRERSLAHRKRIMLRLHDLVFAHQDQLLDLVQLESGKARAHAFEEVVDVALVARHYARSAAAYLRPATRQGSCRCSPTLSPATTRSGSSAS